MHSFYIPVMGVAYTIDTPIRVAHWGISSVVSLGDDTLMERARAHYAQQFKLPFEAVSTDLPDARALRITAYLNLMADLVQQKFEDHKRMLAASEGYFRKFLQTLPSTSILTAELSQWRSKFNGDEFLKRLHERLLPGAIDVNIMTKLDKANAFQGEVLPVIYNDAHAALRGFGNSKIQSALVLSAGMNPRLFQYMEQFSDFFPDEQGQLRKRIIIKVSDFRSALVQGKMLAKKGLWVSEFRVESGLNCGGHAFATQGYLMGPILQEFNEKRRALYEELLSIWHLAMAAKGFAVKNNPQLRITAQGGVGTHSEQQQLLVQYGMDSVGWGSPFLLVPEAVSIDEHTRQQLSEATEKDLYLSNASPLGVPFNNLRSSSRQQYQAARLLMGKVGSPCTKKYLKLFPAFGEENLCTASTKYIRKATQALQSRQLAPSLMEQEIAKLHEKECLCSGLSMPFLEEFGLDKSLEGVGVSVCPGPNLAYFKGKFSLQQMVSHIYGRQNLITRTDRPHMFLKEVQLYIDYLRQACEDFNCSPSIKQQQYLKQFVANLRGGLQYYAELKEQQKLVSGSDYICRMADWQQFLNHCERRLDEVTIEKNLVH